MKEYDSHLEQFKRFEHESAQDNWLLPLRRSGMERFSQTGFPGLNDEDWRFTNVAPISKLPFKPVPATISQRLGSERLAMFPLMGLPANRLVFVDGHFDASLSSVSSGDGEIICSLSSAIRDHKALLEPHLARHVSMESSPFTALNTAFFQDGAFVHLPKGCVLDVPIHLVYVSTSVESGSTSHPRNLIIAGAGSQATILETHTSLHESAYVTNAATEFVLGEGANVEHCKYQDESLAAFHQPTGSLHGILHEDWHRLLCILPVVRVVRCNRFIHRERDPKNRAKYGCRYLAHLLVDRVGICGNWFQPWDHTAQAK